jgi:hypothetical protein
MAIEVDSDALQGVAGEGGVGGQLILAEPLLVVRAGSFTLHGRTLNMAVPLRLVSAVGTAAGASLGHAYVLARLLDSQAPAPRRGTHLRLTGFAPLDLVVDAALGVERPEGWLPARYLAPLASPAFLGVIPKRDGWVAIVDPFKAIDLVVR